VVVAEIRLASACCNDEGIVGNYLFYLAQSHSDGSFRCVDINDFGFHNPNIVLPCNDLPSGRSDFARGKNTGGHLVQQGLEQVVISTINQGDIDIGILKILNSK